MMGETDSPIVAQQAEYFKRLCDTAGVALLSVDPDLTVCYSNNKAAEFFDLPAGKIVGHSVGQVFGQDHRGSIETLMRNAIEHDEVGEVEFCREGSGGRERFLAITISPIRGEGDLCLGASACVRDISRRMQLQDRVGESRKMKALGALAGNFAHHFNNILGSVVTRIDFAKDSHDARIQKRTLFSAADALQRATSLLDGLLAFAEADYRDDDFADLTETLLHYVDKIEPRLTEKGAKLELKLSPIPIVAVPKDHFLTVLENIGGNAIEALPQHGIISIELAASGSQATCTITDSGPGISDETLEHVFEPFFGTKNQEVERNGVRHPGLGLSVALGIVHELGGDISIVSEPERSTAVQIRLPIDPLHPLRENETPPGLFSLFERGQ